MCGAGLCFNLVLALALLGDLSWLGAALILATGMLCLPLGTILGDRVYYGSGAVLILLALATIGMRILCLCIEHRQRHQAPITPSSQLCRFQMFDHAFFQAC